VWLLAIAVATSNIGAGLRTLLASFYGGLALLLLWSLPTLFALRARATRAWVAAVVPVIVGCGIAMLRVDHTNNPLFIIRFLASRESLAREAEAVLVRPPSPAPERVGLFFVDRIEVFQGQARFLSSCSVLDTCGLVYSPLGRPQSSGEDHYTALGGPWYFLFQSW